MSITLRLRNSSCRINKLILFCTDEESVVLRNHLSFKIRPIWLQSPGLSPCHSDGNSDGNEGEKNQGTSCSSKDICWRDEYKNE